MPFSLSAGTITRLGRKLNQNCILPDAFYITPRDSKIFLSAKPKKSATSTNDQSRNLCALPVCFKFKIAGASQFGTIAGVHNFKSP